MEATLHGPLVRWGRARCSGSFAITGETHAQPEPKPVHPCDDRIGLHLWPADCRLDPGTGSSPVVARRTDGVAIHGCLNSFRNETWTTHGQPPAARGVEPWRADRVEQWPADLRAEWPPAGLMAGPPHAAPQAMSRFARVTGHLGRRAAGIGHRPTGGAPALRSPQARRSAS